MSEAGTPTADYEYDLPSHLIASRPATIRDQSRLLVLGPGGAILDRQFPDLEEYVFPGDALVLNQTRVFPARLVGRKPTGARAEVLLMRPRSDLDSTGAVFEALVRPGGKLKPGRVVDIAPGFRVSIEDSTPGGGRLVRLEGTGDPWDLIERHGRVPLPPYLGREDDESDRERYQTVFAKERGSVAAPTAGLHFTRRLLDRLEAGGVRVVRITLHVGIGTFRPVIASRAEDHELHSEWYRVDAAAARTLNEVRDAGGRVFAVGTTSVRTLESVVDPGGRFRPAEGWTDLFIHAPYEFRAVNALVTNFHLPRSSLLMLVSAFAGRERVLEAYAHAVEQEYRFYSYGDAMVIL
jgi:S-adenosylmethionine:tRNA ribosyltransferase-isomerase